MELFELENKKLENLSISVVFPKDISFDEINIVSSSFYSIFINDKLVQFGPYRATNEHLRLNKLKKSAKTNNLKVEFLDYGIETFDLENRNFIFGIELLKDKKIVLQTKDLSFFKNESYLSNSNRYSFQRGFIERHDLTKESNNCKLNTVKNKTASIIGEGVDYCEYNIAQPSLISVDKFHKFPEFKARPFADDRNSIYNPEKIIKSLDDSYTKYEYDFEKIYSGILNFEINSNYEDTIYLIFDEILLDGKWIFSRSTCNDFIEVKLKKGNNTFFSKVPYTLKHLMIVSKNKFLSVFPKMICIQNDQVKIHRTGDKTLDQVIEASERTFKQNAIDIFTDCPGRERAGWLCDSYFSGRAESFFTGNHNIEKCFLENFSYENSPELPKGMVPMCFPSVHKDKTFIPNWALWFIVEVEAYYNDTGDYDLVKKLKQKIYSIFEYFKKFENEFNMLENLESWVFVEWSRSSDEDFLKCISIVSNMIYKGALDSASRLFNDKKLKEKADILKININKIAFNGKYYLDNARRIDGKVVATKDLISETCQYFAYFFEINDDASFLNTIVNANKDNCLEESAVFIGKFLRLLCLYQNNYDSLILEEFVPYFSKMAEKTGTLWEKDQPSASCNHCFASILAPILYDCYKKLEK